METLGAFLDEAAARRPEREAVAYAPRAEVNGRLTWAELREASRTAAKKLLGAGVTKGSRVGLLCPNRLEWLPIAFGALRLGAILVPFSTLWKRDEIAYGLTHGDVEVLVALPRFLKHDYLERLNEIVPELRDTAPGRLRSEGAPALRRVLLLEGEAPGCRAWNDLEADAEDAFLDALEADRVAGRLGDDLLHLGDHREGEGGPALPRRAGHLGAARRRLPGDHSRRRLVGAHAALLERRLHPRRPGHHRRRRAHRPAGGGRPGQRAAASRERALYDHGRLASGGTDARPPRLRPPQAPSEEGHLSRAGAEAPRRRPPSHRRLRHVGDRHFRQRRALHRPRERSDRYLRPAAGGDADRDRRSRNAAARGRAARSARSSSKGRP